MTYTLEELESVLKNQYDPDELLDLFNLTSDQMVEFCAEYIEEHYEELIDVVDMRSISTYNYTNGG